MAAKAITKQPIHWGDRATPWDLLFGILKMVDSTQEAWYRAPGQPAEVTALQEVWYKSSVTRVNTVRLHTPHTRWPTEVEVVTWCSRVGSSSWDMSQQVRGPSGGAVLAEVVTTMVSVDESLTKTVPLPNADSVRAVISPAVFDSGRRPNSGHPVDPTAFSFDRAVSLVDTDSFGHVNNAKWVYLGCEAVHEACFGGALGEEDATALLTDVECVRLDYVGQLTPKDRYTCTVVPGEGLLDKCRSRGVTCHFTTPASEGAAPVCTVHFEFSTVPPSAL